MATGKIDCALLEEETIVNHMSGTLTFSDAASLDDIEDSLPVSLTSSSSATICNSAEQTKYQRLNSSQPGVRFEVIDASIVEDKSGKHVTYTILVMQSLGFDSMPGKTSKRYSELHALWRELEGQSPELMRDIKFPSKRIVGNFSRSTLSARSRAFEHFLTHVFSIEDLRFSKPFIGFLYGDCLSEGYRLIENGLYLKSAEVLVQAWKLQSKVVSSKSYQCVMTLVAVVASYCALEDVDQAQIFADLAIQSFPEKDKQSQLFFELDHKWLVALLRTDIKLSRILSRDTKRLEVRLQDLKKQDICIDQKETLLEMVLHRKELWHDIVMSGSTISQTSGNSSFFSASYSS